MCPTAGTLTSSAWWGQRICCRYGGVSSKGSSNGCSKGGEFVAGMPVSVVKAVVTAVVKAADLLRVWRCQ